MRPGKEGGSTKDEHRRVRPYVCIMQQISRINMSRNVIYLKMGMRCELGGLGHGGGGLNEGGNGTPGVAVLGSHIWLSFSQLSTISHSMGSIGTMKRPWGFGGGLHFVPGDRKDVSLSFLVPGFTSSAHGTVSATQESRICPPYPHGVPGQYAWRDR